MTKEVLAIIPARGGSKRVLKKNTKLLAGKPLIDYTLETALNSKYVTRSVLMTDDPACIERSNRFQKQEVLYEPPELATDNVPAIKYVGHALKVLTGELYRPDAIVVLQPTSPLRTKRHIDEGLELLFNTKADSVVGVKPISEPPEWMYQLKDQEKLEKRIEGNAQNSQQAKKLFILNGAFYGFTPESFQKFDTYLFGGDIRGYVMSQEDSIDIDEEIDFLVAESILKSRNT